MTEEVFFSCRILLLWICSGIVEMEIQDSMKPGSPQPCLPVPKAPAEAVGATNHACARDHWIRPRRMHPLAGAGGGRDRLEMERVGVEFRADGERAIIPRSSELETLRAELLQSYSMA